MENMSERFSFGNIFIAKSHAFIVVAPLRDSRGRKECLSFKNAKRPRLPTFSFSLSAKCCLKIASTDEQ